MAGRGLMGLYLYCLGATGHPSPEGVRGIAGADVVSLEIEDFLAWVSPLDRTPAPSLDGAREHNEVVERACAVETALPLRFGQWFPDRPALEAALRERADSLSAGLERVAGAMEMGIRVLDPSREEAVPDRSTGRAYLEALAGREARTRTARQRGEVIAGELAEWLGTLVIDRRARPLGTTAGLVAISCLVARHDTGNYNARVRDFSPRHPDLRFLFSGPWPPYGFVDEGRQDAA